jgi:hypothetical protein
MKSVLFASLMSFGVLAAACPQPEAQFIATVKSIRPLGAPGHCEITLAQVIQWNENPMCPLDVEEAFAKPVVTTKCDVNAGAQVSGYMVRQDSGVVTF